MQKKGVGVIILKMILAKELFFDLVRRVEQSRQFNQILKKQQQKYQLQPFKLEGIDCRAIKRIYHTLEKKYFETHELAEDPHSWNENERRVFIWYIIFYTHFLAQNNQELNQKHWPVLSSIFFNKRPELLQFQYLTMIKPAKITWTEQEDELLAESVKHQGAGRWNEIAKYYFFTSNFKSFKSPKHCRQRWLNHLDDKKKHGKWSAEQDLAIFNYVGQHGKRWCKLVPILNESRTEHMIKNRYNSLLKKANPDRKKSEEECVARIRKQLQKQVETNQRKRLRREEAGTKMSLQGCNAEEEQQPQKAQEAQEQVIKVQEVGQASFQNKIIPSEKTSSCQNAKQLKEENEVGYIMHKVEEQKNKCGLNESVNTIIKAEEFQQQINSFNQNSSFPMFGYYPGLGYLPAYPYCWL